MHLIKRCLWMLLLSFPLPTVAAPTIVEQGYKLSVTWTVDDPASAIYNPKDGFVYALKRFSSADGVYRLSSTGGVTQIASATYPASLAVDLAGNLYFSEDYSGGVYRLAYSAWTKSLWVSGFNSTTLEPTDSDDDPYGLTFAPSGHSSGIMPEGAGLVADRGNGGPDDVWGFVTSTAEGEILLMADDGTLTDVYDVAISDDSIYLLDTKTCNGGAIYRLYYDSRNKVNDLALLSTSSSIACPTGIAYDARLDRLLIHDKSTSTIKAVYPSTGKVSTVISGVPFLNYGGIDVSPTGLTIVVTTTTNVHKFLYDANLDDNDGDGYTEDEGDCNDADKNISPVASESCNSKDDDCDGLIDINDPSVTGTASYYTDADADGYGSSSATKQIACPTAPPAGKVTNNLDCNDSDKNTNPAATESCNSKDDDCDGKTDDADSPVTGTTTWYLDADGDGFGATASTKNACVKPAGYSSTSGDCDDSSAAVKPSAPEICNGIDDDCDSKIDMADTNVTGTSTYYPDVDKDNHGANIGVPVTACPNAPPSGSVTSKDDCNDLDNTVYTGALELCDLKDNDCDGIIDDGAVQGTFYQDADGDGYGNVNVKTTSCIQPPGYIGNSTDCNDSSAQINPSATEICDGKDNDCNGTIDLNASNANTYYKDVDGDGYGQSSSTVRECNQPGGYAVRGGDCNDQSLAINPGAVELCDGLDNDCDLLTDDADPSVIGQGRWYKDADADTYGNSSQEALTCSTPAGYVSRSGDCNDNDASVNPGKSEICNGGIDDNCNALADDADPAIQSSSQSITGAVEAFKDKDGDGYGLKAESKKFCITPQDYAPIDGDCDDTRADVNPAASELPDGVDNNCDGQADEGTILFDDDGDGATEEEGDCNDANPKVSPTSTESCNAADDDCDGAVDEDFDQDGDGYTSASFCSVSEVPNSGDCDDTDPTRFPNAEPTCDGLDTDCDGIVPDLSLTSEADADQDGFRVCAGDCNDSNASISPNQSEVPGDGIDQNCDGEDEATPTPEPTPEPTPTGTPADTPEPTPTETPAETSTPHQEDTPTTTPTEPPSPSEPPVETPTLPPVLDDTTASCSCNTGANPPKPWLGAAMLLILPLLQRRWRSTTKTPRRSLLRTGLLLLSLFLLTPKASAQTGLVLYLKGGSQIQALKVVDQVRPRGRELAMPSIMEAEDARVMGPLRLSQLVRAIQSDGTARTCPSDLPPFLTLLGKAEEALDFVEIDKVRNMLFQARVALECGQTIIDEPSLARYMFLNGVLEVYANNAGSRYFELALAIQPTLSDPTSYQAQVQRSFARARARMKQEEWLQVKVLPLDYPELSLQVDGKKVLGELVKVLPGQHLVQLVNSDGVLLASRMVELKSDGSSPILPPESMRLAPVEILLERMHNMVVNQQADEALSQKLTAMGRALNHPWVLLVGYTVEGAPMAWWVDTQTGVISMPVLKKGRAGRSSPSGVEDVEAISALSLRVGAGSYQGGGAAIPMAALELNYGHSVAMIRAGVSASLHPQLFSVNGGTTLVFPVDMGAYVLYPLEVGPLRILPGLGYRGGLSPVQVLFCVQQSSGSLSCAADGSGTQAFVNRVAHGPELRADFTLGGTARGLTFLVGLRAWYTILLEDESSSVSSAELPAFLVVQASVGASMAF
ncbi:MAG: MopE-related protein [Myxococcota bacterium]